MSTHAATVARQLAALEATLARPRTHETARPMSDEEIAFEMALEQRAEERMNGHMSDRDADHEADRYENRTERWAS